MLNLQEKRQKRPKKRRKRGQNWPYLDGFIRDLLGDGGSGGDGE